MINWDLIGITVEGRGIHLTKIVHACVMQNACIQLIIFIKVMINSIIIILKPKYANFKESK